MIPHATAQPVLPILTQGHVVTSGARARGAPPIHTRVHAPLW